MLSDGEDWIEQDLAGFGRIGQDWAGFDSIGQDLAGLVRIV